TWNREMRKESLGVMLGNRDLSYGQLAAFLPLRMPLRSLPDDALEEFQFCVRPRDIAAFIQKYGPLRSRDVTQGTVEITLGEFETERKRIVGLLRVRNALTGSDARLNEVLRQTNLPLLSRLHDPRLAISYNLSAHLMDGAHAVLVAGKDK